MNTDNNEDIGKIDPKYYVKATNNQKSFNLGCLNEIFLVFGALLATVTVILLLVIGICHVIDEFVYLLV